MGRGSSREKGGNCESRRENRRFFRETLIPSVKALAEISDFVAGLMQRVPKKPNEMMADLQNSTAALVKKVLKKKV